MERFMNEVWAVVEELPDNAQKIWNQAFQEALLEVKGDMRKAAAMAWKAFKGKGQGVKRLEISGEGENREDLQQEMEGKGEENEEIKRFLLEMKQLLQVHGEISLKKVKQAIVDLKTQQEIGHGLKGAEEGQMSQGVAGKPIKEAIKKDPIKPDQRILAGVKGNREFQEFQDFLEIGARDATKKQRMRWGFPFFRSMLKWAFRKQYKNNQYVSCG
jgi:hypothetical protein